MTLLGVPTERTATHHAGYDDFWVRRTAMLCLLRPLRQGDGDFERFSRYADAMLADKELFIRKASAGFCARQQE